MTHSIIFRPVAQAEHLKAVEWYEDQQSGLGQTFDAAVQTLLVTIANHPDRYPIADGDIREAPVHRYPYTVYYRLRSEYIEVLAVFHQSRNPTEWQSRL